MNKHKFLIQFTFYILPSNRNVSQRTKFAPLLYYTFLNNKILDTSDSLHVVTW